MRNDLRNPISVDDLIYLKKIGEEVDSFFYGEFKYPYPELNSIKQLVRRVGFRKAYAFCKQAGTLRAFFVVAKKIRELNSAKPHA